MNSIFSAFGKLLARYLSKPMHDYKPAAICDNACFCAALKPGDVILVDGNSRVSSAIKYLTQSTWSHAALYVGPINGRGEPDGEPHVLVEADIVNGVISAPISEYFGVHTRICRPMGISNAEIAELIAYVLKRIGHRYDLKNVVDLARYLLPTPPVPTRFRRRMIAFGSGEPTRAICSTLIAQAFQSIGYPILPEVQNRESKDEAGADLAKEVWHIRHYSLFTPRDFDISPYFAIVKPELEMGFDHHAIVWDRL